MKKQKLTEQEKLDKDFKSFSTILGRNDSAIV